VPSEKFVPIVPKVPVVSNVLNGLNNLNVLNPIHEEAYSSDLHSVAAFPPGMNNRASVLSRNFLDTNSEVIPGKLAIASATRNPGKFKEKPGFPKFTNEVQHFLYKVLQWDSTLAK
jgi:hypothetical protein